MSGSSGPSKKQIDLQEKSLEESRRVGDAQIAYLEKQTQALRQVQTPIALPSAPPPTPGTADTDFAAMQAKLNAKRRYGYGRSVLAGAA